MLTPARAGNRSLQSGSMYDQLPDDFKDLRVRPSDCLSLIALRRTTAGLPTRRGVLFRLIADLPALGQRGSEVRQQFQRQETLGELALPFILLRLLRGEGEGMRLSWALNVLSRQEILSSS